MMQLPFGDDPRRVTLVGIICLKRIYKFRGSVDDLLQCIFGFA